MRRALLLSVVLAMALAPSAGAQERRVVKDPGGAPAWTAQLRAGADGRDCAVLRRGRLAKGTYCARLSPRRVYAYVQRRETAADPRRARTIFLVTLARSVTVARIETPDGVQTYRRGRGPRVLLAVLAGKVERSPLLVTSEVAGSTATVRTGDPLTVTVADPLGGAAWRLAPDRDTPADEERCVAWERVPPRYGEPAGERRVGRRQCGDADVTLPVAVAERVEGRLVITGASSPEVRSIALRGPGGPAMAVRRDARSGEFLAVLPGDADPDALTVVATLRDGRTLTQALRTAV